MNGSLKTWGPQTAAPEWEDEYDQYHLAEPEPTDEADLEDFDRPGYDGEDLRPADDTLLHQPGDCWLCDAARKYHQ